MANLLKIIVIVFSCLVLAACQPVRTEDYLLTHPEDLKSEMDVCHEPGIKTDAQMAHCEIVMSAADKFIKLLNDQQHDPEAFGVRVMDAQNSCVAKKVILDNIRQHLSDLLGQQAPAAEIEKATDEINKANADYAESYLQVKILLAVIGVNSPE